MNIALQATVKSHTSTPQFATIYVQVYLNEEGQPEILGTQDMVTVPAVYAQAIAVLINQKP